MTKIITKILCICLLTLYSCKQQTVFNRNNATCNIDLKKMDSPSFKEYFSKIELIPLETSDSSLIKSIDERIFYKGKFYICDNEQKRVLVFDRTGKFRFTIDKRGNGPGEYSDLSSFQINRFTDDLELLSPMGGILRYDSIGHQYKGKIPLPTTITAAHYFISLNENTYLFFSDSRDGNKMLAYDAEKKEIVSEMYNLPRFIFFNTFYHHSYTPFYLLDNRIHFIQAYNGDVFTFENNALLPKYKWDFGEQNFEISNLEDKPIEYYMRYDNSVGSKYANTFVSYGENSKYFLTNFSYNHKLCTLIYDKQKKKCITFNAFAEKHRLIPGSVNEEAVYHFSLAQNINEVVDRDNLDDENKKIYDSISNDDNPVIVKYSFK